MISAAATILPASVQHAHVAIEWLLAITNIHLVVSFAQPQGQLRPRVRADWMLRNVLTEVAGTYGARIQVAKCVQKRFDPRPLESGGLLREVGGKSMQQRPASLSELLLGRRPSLLKG